MIQLNKFNIYVLLLDIFLFITVIQCQLMEHNDIYYKQRITSFSHQLRNIQGSSCYHKRSQSKGTCKKLINCKKALLDMWIRHLSPELCNHKDHKIVCCPKKYKNSIRKSREMCSYYAKLAYKKKHQSLVNVPGATPKNESQCGDQFHPIIFGGTKAEAKEFPHMALIGYDGDNGKVWACGGSLISEEWILTAAHCEYLSDKIAKYVRLGELDYKRNRGLDYKISEIKRHDHYNKNTHYNDIALFKLQRKATLNAYVRPACLWTKHQIKKNYNNNAIATGWGITSGVKNKGSTFLLKVVLNLIPQKNCSSYSDKYDKERLPKGVLKDIQICAHGPNESKTFRSTCKGDSGGPLQIFNGDQCMYYIIGVTSINKHCGSSPVPGVYTRVSNYIPWIANIVWPKQ